MMKDVFTILAALGCSTALFAQQEVAQQRKPASERTEQPQQDARCAAPNWAPPDCALSDRVPPAYNMSARVDPDRGYDVELDASFIYWNVAQEYMDVGTTALFATGEEAVATPSGDATVLMQPFQYQPGFKVGLGFGSDFDNWQFGVEYTYMHHSNTMTTGSAATSFADGEEIIIPNEWYIHLSTGTQQQMGLMTSTWHMNLDMLDALLSRPFYQGQRLALTPYAGLRALWVRQHFHVVSNFASDPVAQEAVSDNRSKSWAIGPKLGLDFNWLLGMGFRLEFDTAMSLLYTRYTSLTHTESYPNAITATLPVNGHLPARGQLRAINDLGVGFGWGMYCCNKRYHVDFSARYDFSIFWQQNMMRYLVGALAEDPLGYANPVGCLYLHGMTLSGCFGF